MPKTKYDELHYRERAGDLRNEWLRCQIGAVSLEKRVPKHPPEPVFHLIGFGRTMFEAEQMVEKKLGRAL
jgi:hypothetical protein